MTRSRSHRDLGPGTARQGSPRFVPEELGEAGMWGQERRRLLRPRKSGQLQTKAGVPGLQPEPPHPTGNLLSLPGTQVLQMPQAPCLGVL